MTQSVQAKRAAFRALHAEGCFVLPNPWDAGSALMLQGLGFRALASTSSGFLEPLVPRADNWPVPCSPKASSLRASP